MGLNSEATLDPPPRKAHFRRGVRNMRRGYSSLFLLVILVLAGWAALDIYQWQELTREQRVLAVGFGALSLLVFLVWRLVGRPSLRELRLARRGEVARGQIVSVGKSKRKWGGGLIFYSFTTSAGLSVTGESRLPRRFPAETLEPGMEIEILYDPKKPKINKARLALQYVEFGESPKPRPT